MSETTARETPPLPRPEAGADTAVLPRADAGAGGTAGGQLFRNAYALMLNTGVSALLGVGYWVLAAHYYSPASVGRGSAAIAAMKFLAGITAVTLTGALARFIPVSGRHTGRFVARTYLASCAVVAAAATAFLLTLGLWGSSFHFLHGPLPGLLFVGAVVAWSLLTLQDGVLTGLRSAVWVPVGNTVFSLAKLALLVAVAAAVPATGVFVSWAAAIGLSVVPLGWLVFRRLIPRHVAATASRSTPPTARQVRRFLAGDYTGSLFALAVVYLVPVIVAARISPKDNAYFYVTATIGGTVDLLAVNMGASLTVEGAHDPSRIAENLRAALLRMARIMVPVCVLMLLLAPHLLRVFGPGYAAQGGPLLRFMAVASLTRVLFEAYFGVLRAQSRTSRIALLQGLLCLLVLTSTLLLLPPLGIVGAGVAELGSQSVVAAIACFGLVRILREGRPAAGTDRDRGDGTGHDGDPPAPAVAEPPVPVRKSAPEAAGPPTARRTADDRLAEAGGWVVLAAALVLYWAPLASMRESALDRMGGLGLVSVLPYATVAGAALLVVAFCWALWLPVPRKALLLAVLLATVVSLHAAPALLEAQPRFATAWQHAGFIEYLDRTGTARPYLDARFSWPGFFAGAALVTRSLGITDLTGVLRWWPTAMQLLYLLPLALILRAVRADWRAKWCAAWLFVLCGWVGQDYFSPQSLNIFLYLVFVAVLLVWFRPAEHPGPLRGGRVPGEAEAPAGVGRRDRAVLLGLLLAVFTASVASHQLTPFVMLGVAAVLVLRGHSTLRGLPVLCGVLVAAWVGFLAEPYWSGHFNELFGGMGSLGGNVSSSVSGRMQGGSATHELVLYARVALAGGVMGLAAFGWLRRRLVGIGDRTLPILLLVPFLGFGMQSYGGEMALRVFLFALPGACVLGALAFFPRTSGGRPGHGVLAALLVGQLLVFGFLVARWGNEDFERVRPGEVAAMDWVYAHDSPTARLLWPTEDPVGDVTPSLPWGARDMDRVGYQGVLAPPDPSRVAGMVADLKAAGPQSYLLVTTGTATYLELNAGYPADWQRRVVAALDARGDLHKVLSGKDAALYRTTAAAAGPVPQPTVGGAGPVVTWTWPTVLGAVAGVALLLLLCGRELARVLVDEERRRAGMRLSFRLALPLLAVFLAALVERFATLS